SEKETQGLPKNLRLHSAHGGNMSLIMEREGKDDHVVRFDGGICFTTDPEVIQFLLDELQKDKYIDGDKKQGERAIEKRKLLTPEEWDQYVLKDKNYFYFDNARRPVAEVREALQYAVEKGFKFKTAGVKESTKAKIGQGAITGS